MLRVFVIGILQWNWFPRKRAKNGARPQGCGSRFDPKKQQGSPIPAYSFITPHNSERLPESPISRIFRTTATAISSGYQLLEDYSHE
jgi:hypothetical protein